MGKMADGYANTYKIAQSRGMAMQLTDTRATKHHNVRSMD
jgi:hypothetical protein